jgi:hypothetical protein
MVLSGRQRWRERRVICGGGIITGGAGSWRARHDVQHVYWSDSRAPDRGVSAAMKYRQHNNAMWLYAKINAVRKTMGNDTPNILAHNGVL